MGRRLRWIPAGGSLVEVSCKTVGDLCLLQPSPRCRELVVGVLARAKARHPQVEVIHLCYLSNHYHLLLWVPDAQAMRGFMHYAQTHIATEIGRLVGWRGPFWNGRYHASIVSDEPAAQIARLRYLMDNGVKESLVASPLEWPGAHGAQALMTGEPLQGVWVDRTKRYRALQRGEELEADAYTERLALELDPLPCWRHLSGREYRRRIAEMIRDIERRGAARGIEPLGREAVRRIQPMHRPAVVERSPQPWFHCATRQARRRLFDAYGTFVEAFYEAVARLRRGLRPVLFPDDCFPPRPRPALFDPG